MQYGSIFTNRQSIIKKQRFLIISPLGGTAHPIAARFIRYNSTAGLATLTDMGLLMILVEFFGAYYLFAAGLSFIVAHSLNYSIAGKWGFKESKEKHKRAYFAFIGLGLLSFVLTLTLLRLAVEYFGAYYITARLAVLFTVGLFSFLMNYYFIFRLHLLPERKR